MTAVIGVISDTHGLLRPEAVTALEGSDYIFHAGDVGDPDILTVLRSIAPVTAIRGNIDPPHCELPATVQISLAGRRFYMIHDLNDLQIDPIREGVHVVISGHSHKPSIESRENVMYLNPGSAGKRRFKLPVTLAKIVLCGVEMKTDIVHLLRPAAGRADTAPKNAG